MKGTQVLHSLWKSKVTPLDLQEGQLIPSVVVADLAEDHPALNHETTVSAHRLDKRACSLDGDRTKAIWRLNDNSLITREVLPEFLDTLDHDDVRARRSREELRMINGVMGNYRWLRRRLSEPQLEGQRVLELGAGDGAFARQVWREGITNPSLWTALDLTPEPDEWSREARWLQRDLFTISALPEAEIVVANLFLHHLQDIQLAALGRLLPLACHTLLACEPARRRVHIFQGRALSALAGLSKVTHHDMLVSIRAGFANDELPEALGLHDWQARISLTALGAYRLEARR
jgi:hypothetical protein